MDPDYLRYHQQVKNNEHLFIYGVAGRSSSTALQRLLNSSNEVFIWGEPHYIVDDLAEVMEKLNFLDHSTGVRTSLERIESCFRRNKHDQFYPNAVGNLQETNDHLSALISGFLRPSVSMIQRFGYKEIRLKSIKTLEKIRNIYPNSKFIFCFRDPAEQWLSVNTVRWWDYSTDLAAFLVEYKKLSDIYLQFVQNVRETYFVESTDILDLGRMKRLVDLLGLRSMDESLVRLMVSTVKKNAISDEESSKIMDSASYQNYVQMKEKSGHLFSSF
jgi:hypothetical protein